MNDQLINNDSCLPGSMSRRGFIKWNAALGSLLAAAGVSANGLKRLEESGMLDSVARLEDRIVRVGCPSHNCGGRCLLKVHIKDGVITRIEGDDRPADDIADPQLRPCTRGRSYRRRQYHPDRLKYPMKRVGRRGEGKFERISWDEALDTVASEMLRIKKQYGNSALFVPYGTGSYSTQTAAISRGG